MATQRIIDFLNTRRPEGPCLVVDTDVVRENYQGFEKLCLIRAFSMR